MDVRLGGGGFHRPEAISAVQDEEQLYGEDDDYNDLYNDVNVGEGFLPSHHHSNGSHQIRDNPPLPPPALPPPLSRPTEPFQPQIAEPPPGPRSQAPPHARVSYGVGGNGSGGDGGGGGTTLFIGDLHWWTTDADLESELCKYGQVKEVKFFDEKSSGKSKGYCQVDFYDSMAAAACKEGMNGHLFNGRPCVVAFSSPFSVRRMGESQVNKNRPQGSTVQSQPLADQKGRGGGSGNQMGGNYGRGGGGNWGRGGMGGRGPMGNMRSRMGPIGGRGIMGNGGMVAPPPTMMHPGAMLSQGFDPMGYGVAMGRMGAGYGGFPTGPATAPFPGMLPTFTQVVAPHVNPAFFGRGMPPGGVGMWPDPSMGGWGGEDQSSYGEDAMSDQQYGEGGHGKDMPMDRDWSNVSERRPERDYDIGNGQELSERRQHGSRDPSRDRDRDRERDRERERERERDRHRDDRDRHDDHYRHRDCDSEHDEWDRARPSRAQNNPREFEHGKRHMPTE